MLSDRYKDAMIFAAELHASQTRKGSEIAYLTHLLSVSALVLENGGDEDEGIAALLHDALEDQGEHYRSESSLEPQHGRDALKRDIAQRFGTRVRDIVIGCTDDEDFVKPSPGERGSVEAWRRRKEAYIARIGALADRGILRVSSADKLHNARTILLDLYEHGERTWSRFRAGSKDGVLWYYRALAGQFRHKAGALGDRGLQRLSSELERTVSQLDAYPGD